MNPTLVIAAALEPTLVSRVTSVASDHISVASALTSKAIAILTEACLFDRATIDTVSCALCATQPAMAPVWNIAALVAGGDEVGLRCFINKSGTLQLVTASASLDVPAEAVASCNKFINVTLAPELRPNENHPEEVW